jgi:isopentenyldiphosphate isomerase
MPYREPAERLMLLHIMRDDNNRLFHFALTLFIFNNKDTLLSHHNSLSTKGFEKPHNMYQNF